MRLVLVFFFKILILFSLPHICASVGNGLAEEDVDIGGNEPPVSSYPPVEIEKDTGHRISKNISPGSSNGN